MQVLNSYSLASGQRINLAKSGIIFSSLTNAHTKSEFSNILNIPPWDNPGQYLGLPAVWGRNKTNSLAWIKDTIKDKMDGWKGTLLNQAGKEVLIKSVLQAIPCYAMAIVRFPKTFCSTLNSMVANFWWRGQGRERGIHWKSWECISQRKDKGGMGFRDFNCQNIANLAKQAWRVMTNPEALWVRTLKSIYFPNHNFLDAPLGHRPSWTWRSLLEGRDFIKANGKWAVGNGASINVWNSSWIASGERLDKPTLAPDLPVSDLISPSGGGWDLYKLVALFPPLLIQKILVTPTSFMESPDVFFWPYTTRGDYTVSSGYKVALENRPTHIVSSSSSHHIQNEIWGHIWGCNVPQKIKHFLWRACHNSLAVKSNLHRRRLADSSLCPICHLQPETVEHMLLLCPWTRPVWYGSPLQWSINPIGQTSFDAWLLDRIVGLLTYSTDVNRDLTTLCCILWTIWKGRNRTIFQLKDPSPFSALQQASLLASTADLIKPVREKEITIEKGKHSRGTSWCPPTKEVLKINVDAAWTQGLQFSSIGIVIRDCFASIVAGDHRLIRSSSPLMAEALAIREGLLLAHNLGCPRVLIESDNLSLIDACKAGMMQGEISTILSDIFLQKNQFQLCSFTWTNREKNCVAHEIARLCLQHLLNVDWIFNPPHDLRRAMTIDAIAAAEINGFPNYL